MTTNGASGDPKLKLTIVIAILGPLLAGAVTWVSTVYSVRAEIRDSAIETKTYTAAEVDKHRSEGHMTAPTRDEMRELKSDLKDIKVTLDRLREDVAVLKGRRK